MPWSCSGPNFADRPALGTYLLRESSGKDLPEWRDWALALLREQPVADTSTGWAFLEPACHSTLVEVLLWEQDVDAAWEAAQAGGCRGPLWLDLARERGKTHPADAIPILQHAAEQAIGHKNRSAYRDAARLRADHKPKRALREALDRVRLPG